MKGLRTTSPMAITCLKTGAVIATTFAVYFNILFNGFVIDDSFQIVGNRWIKDVRYIPEIFSSNFVLGGKTAFYRPLIHVFYMVSYHLFGPAPWGFHLMSIILHAGVSVLVFLTISRLLRGPRLPDISRSISSEEKERLQWVPLAAALMFATHPIHTEAVAWISVTDVHMTFFYLLSFYLYVRSSEKGSTWGVAYALSVVSFFLATLCKEPALTLPAALVAYDYVSRNKGKDISYYIKRYVPFLVAGGVYFALRLRALGGMVVYRTTVKLSPYEYFIDVLSLFRKYVEKLLLPVNLNVWHVFRPPETLFSLSGMASFLVAAAFVIIAVVAIRKTRIALLGFVFIIVPLVPALYLPGLTQGLENAFTERYLYLPSFGFIVLVSLLIRSILKSVRNGWGSALTVALAVTIALYSYGSSIRTTVWKDLYSIWADSVQKSPGSAVAHNGLGDALRERGQYNEAIRHYRAALRVDPGNPFSHANLGLVYADKGLPDMAIRELHAALRLKPDYAEAYDFLGVVYGTLGEHARAAGAFETALRLNPELDYVYNHLGSAYDNLGMPQKAIELFLKAIQKNPDNAEAHNNLGIAFGKMGKADKAIEHFLAALRLEPNNPVFHYNISNAYLMKGLTDKAEEHRRQAKRLQDRGIP